MSSSARGAFHGPSACAAAGAAESAKSARNAAADRIVVMRRKIPSFIPRMEPGPAPTGPARSPPTRRRAPSSARIGGEQRGDVAEDAVLQPLLADPGGGGVVRAPHLVSAHLVARGEPSRARMEDEVQ